MFLPIKRWHAAAVLSVLVACGGGGGGGPAPGAPPPPAEPAPTGTLAVLAGDTGIGGYADGAGRLARFQLPSAIAVDAAGDIFVADTFNLAIRKVTPQGVVTTPWRDAGRVRDLAFAPGGDLYFTANDEQFAAVYRATPSGQVTTVVEAGVIRGAWSIAAGADGTLYVSSPAGLHRFKPGAAPALMAAVPRLLRQLVVDGAGNVYGSMVTEDAVLGGVQPPSITQPARSAVIVQVRPDGTWSPYVGSAQDPRYADGPRADARLSNADGLALDATGRLWVAENHVEGRQSGMVRRVSAEGVVSSPFGTRVLFKHGLSADVAFDRMGTLYALTGNGIAKIGVSGEVTPLAGSAMPEPPEQAPIRALQLAVSAGSDIYAAEPVGTQVKVRKFDADGRRVAFGPDGQGVEVPGLDPQDIATLNTLSMVLDGGGNIHLAFARIQQTPSGADGFVYRALGGAILRITPQGQLNTVRSSETFGPTDRFAPSGIAVNAQGEYRYLDLVDGKLHRRTASGEPTRAPLDLQIPLTTQDARMPRFVGDRDDHGWVIDAAVGKLLRVNPAPPLLTAFAGSGSFGTIADGPGAQARFAALRHGVADARGNLLVTDHTTLRRVAADGSVVTLAGRPREFGATDDLVAGALPGMLGNPRTLAVGPDGAIYMNAHGALVRVRLH